MPAIHITFEEPAFPDLESKIREGQVIHLAEDARVRITALEQGTAQGKPSVALAIALPDGKEVLLEITLALFLTTADALKARYGDPR